MRASERRRAYWRANLRMTATLLAVWFVVTFGGSWFARELNQFAFIGPLGFYMGAQGALIVYVVIIWFYARYMNRLDQHYGVHEDDAPD